MAYPAVIPLRMGYPQMVAAVVWGTVITVVVGVIGVTLLLDWMERKFDPYKGSNEALKEIWPKSEGSVLDRTIARAGFWVGIFERLIFFAALWIPSGWPLLSTWLVLKTAIYWKHASYGDVVRSANGDRTVLADVYKVRAYHAKVALVGTAANIVTALLGVAFSYWVLATMPVPLSTGSGIS